MAQLRSLFDVWTLYEKEVRATEHKTKANASLAQLKTALFRYTLPGYGFPAPEGNKLTERETEVGLKNMKQVNLELLQEARYVQQQLFDSLQVPGNSQRNYRAALKKLMAWCETQPWWQTSLSTFNKKFISPRQHKGSAHKVQVTGRRYKDEQGAPICKYQYGLNAVEGDVVPESLGKELDAFRKFRTDPNGTNPEKVVKKSTVNNDLKRIRLILGWLHRYRGVPLEELCLRKMVLPAPLKSATDNQGSVAQAKVAAEQTVELARDYLCWLRADQEERDPESQGRGIQSPYTEIDILKTFVVVAKFLDHEITEHSRKDQYRNSLVIDLLHLETNQAQCRIRHHCPVSDNSKKWLEWTEYLAFVEELRKECVPRLLQKGQSKKSNTSLSPPRSSSALAFSYQRFILAALFAYIPPKRQQIYRELQFGYPGQLKNEEHPDGTPETSGCLYKTDKWWLYLPPGLQKPERADPELSIEIPRLLPDLYQTVENYEELSIEVPNLHYPGGCCFYQYLEEWQNGLREVFKPQHDYVFTKKNGRKYSHPTEFSDLLRNPVYRLTGKVLTPHLLMKIFDSHIKKLLNAETRSETIDSLSRYSQESLRNNHNWLIRHRPDELRSRLAWEVAQNFIDFNTKPESTE